MQQIRDLKRRIRGLIPREFQHSIAMARGKEPVMALLAERCREGIFIDVGANNGVFIHHLRRAAGKIEAFEPIPSLAADLRRRYPNVTVHDCALSDRRGDFPLHVPHLGGDEVLSRSSLNVDANPGFKISTRMVATRRLDDFEFSNVKVIKIDVEGHEEAVLRGAIETIGRERPVLLVEIEERHHPGESQRLIAWLEACGYVVQYHDGAEWRSASNFDFNRLQKPENLKRAFGKASGPYINNFLFLPS